MPISYEDSQIIKKRELWRITVAYVLKGKGIKEKCAKEECIAPNLLKILAMTFINIKVC